MVPFKNVIAMAVREVTDELCNQVQCPETIRRAVIADALLMGIVVEETVVDRDAYSFPPKEYNDAVSQICKEVYEDIQKKVKERILTLPKLSELN